VSSTGRASSTAAGTLVHGPDPGMNGGQGIATRPGVLHLTVMRHILEASVLLALSLAVTACEKAPPPAPPPAPAPPPVVEKKPILDDAQRKQFQALPENFGAATEAQIVLGKTLFHDPRLSLSQDISCNSCHTLSNYGVDGQPTSTGFKGQKGGRNSPTVFNAAGHATQFWDGRSPHVEDQAKGPVLNPIEMAIKDDKAAVDILRSIPGYLPLFTAAFPEEKVAITWDTYAKAVGAFERQLVTPSRFDAWAKGDDTALTEAEQKGALKFMENGCMACHMGPLFGGNGFQKVGAVKPWPNDKDRGRKDLTKNDADDMMFKVPSLRNIEKTAPYFHDGSVASLDEAVKMMARHQLGRELSDEDTASIVTFLKTLTGELPQALIAEPTLPESGPRTPKPVKG
jgi:cytochrome c peroxidase